MCSVKVILLSGKRKSGKDYLSERLKEYYGPKCELIRISEPIKSHFAEKLNLSLDELMSSSGYKEKFRSEMIQWSEEVRKSDYGYFCRAACSKAQLKPLFIVCDVRRKTDLQWFRENYNEVKTIHLKCDDEVRKARGWIFVEGIDDAESECNLDDIADWDFVFENDDSDTFEASFVRLLNLINE